MSPPEVFSEDEWKLFNKIVVPQRFHEQMMSLAHDTNSAGHLGVKT